MKGIQVNAFVDEGLGNSSYLVALGDTLGDSGALVVDPQRDASLYLAAAEASGTKVVYSVETHLHADFVSGSRELAARGSTVLASRASGIEFPHRGLGHGEEVDLGGLTMRALATPGHTPEHLSYLLLDGAAPRALFTGGSLLVGAVARTDLVDPGQTEDLARALYRSIHDQILTLPDEVPVYPTHGAGSFCSAPAGSERVTTIGRERDHNPLLAAPDEDAFVKLLLGSLGSYPPYFLRLREVNRRGPQVLGSAPPLPLLSAAEVERFRGDGAEVVDARPIAEYARGHVPGSLSIALREVFATWLGWLVEPERPLVFILNEKQDRADLVRQARGIGYECLAGELEGGMRSWRGGVETVELTTPDRLSRGYVLDVRQDAEFAAGHVPGSLHRELGALTDSSLLPDGPVTLVCGHGERAMTGASLLARAGRGGAAVLVGGPTDWSVATGIDLAVSVQ